jgi:glycosyltransferase involved in cell wall biosynthesis
MAKQNIKLSILILSLPNRIKSLERLTSNLEEQIGDRQDVEILSLMDNRSYNVSEKRNVLMSLARGSHLTWIDDDDNVSKDYISRITETIENNPEVDVISFDQQCYLEGIPARVFAKMGNPHQDAVIDPETGVYKDILRPPYHWCIWKSELAKSESFRFGVFTLDSHVGEDIDWLQRLYPKVKNSVYLEGEYLHIYTYWKEVSESK